MWVVSAAFDGITSGDNHPTKDKLLRPGRTYPLGRKLKSPLQLVINNPKVSGDHATLIVGEHPVVDLGDPAKIPSLTFHNPRNKPAHIARGKDRIIVNPLAQQQLEDGDVIGIVAGIHLTVHWRPMCCFVMPFPDQLDLPADKCASLGIKITPLPLQGLTHCLLPRLNLSAPVCTSLVSSAQLVKPEWLHDLLKAGTIPQDPTNPDGPSKLESEFILPSESQYSPGFDPALPSTLKNRKIWDVNEKRKDMFNGWRFMFVGEKGRETNSQMKELVDRGGGSYDVFDVAGGTTRWQQAITRSKRKVDSEGGQGMAVIADEISMRAAVGEKWDELVNILKSMKLCFISPNCICEAVVYVDHSYINASAGTSSDEQEQEESSLPDFVPNTHPDEPSILPADNPEPEIKEVRSSGRTLRRRVTPQPVSRPPSRTRSRAPSQAPEPIPIPTPEGRDVQAEIALPPSEDQPVRSRRTLVRRAKTNAETAVDESGDLTSPSSQAVTSTIDAPIAPPPVPPPTVDVESQVARSGRASRLKRRLGTTADSYINDITKAIEETQSKGQPPLKKFRDLFDASDPDRISSQMPMSGIIESQMEDESITQAEQSQTQQSRPLAPVLEEEETPSQAPVSVNSAIKRKLDALANDGTQQNNARPTKRRALEDTGRTNQAELPQQTQVQIEPATRSEAQPAMQHKKTGGTGATPGKPDQDTEFLKALASKKKGKKNEDAFDREFNNLRISKPDLQRQQADRRTQEDFDVLADFGDDGDLRGNFMVVMELDVPERERRGIRRGDERIDWEGRQDYKKFKRKDINRGRTVIELFAGDQSDYGMGSAYWKGNAQSQVPSQSEELVRPSRHARAHRVLHADEEQSSQKPSSQSRTRTQKTQKEKSQGLHVIDSDESDVPEAPPTKGKRRATSKQPSTQSQARSRRKGQQLFLGSEEEDEQEVIEIPEDIEMENVDDVSTIRSSGENREELPPVKSSRRKKAAILDDDSDTGITFKGFDSRKKRKVA